MSRGSGDAELGGFAGGPSVIRRCFGTLMDVAEGGQDSFFP